MYSNRGSGCGIAFERLFLTPEIRNSNSIHQTFSEHFSTRMEKSKTRNLTVVVELFYSAKIAL